MGQQLSIGDISLRVPDGWREIASPDGSLIARSPDDRQQVTLSVSRLQAPISFDEFKKICAVRLQTEKQQLADGGIEPNPTPFQKDNFFGFVFSGMDRKTRRIFSAYLSSAGKELGALYLESFAIHPNQHTDTFKTLIANLKRNQE